jgi:hypothetical protein
MSQLLQTTESDLDVTSSGAIERDQQGQSNKYNYNYKEQNTIRRKKKLRRMLEEDSKREELMVNKKRTSRIARMANYGINLIKGEDKILESKTDRLMGWMQ